MHMERFTPQVGQAYETFIPIDIEKSGEKDGRRIIYGRASDETMDLDNEVISSTGIQKSLEYFKKYGKFDWDHKSKNDPAFLIGEPLDAGVKNGELFVKGELYKGMAVADTTWNLLKNKAKLGFSIAGKVLEVKAELNKSTGETTNKVTKLIMTKIAVTPQPKNFNTYCLPWGEFAKSLSGSDTEMTDEEIQAAIEKSMDTGGGSNPMIGQSLEKKVHTTTYGKDVDPDKIKEKKEKKSTEEEEITMKSIDAKLDTLEKSISELEKAIKRDYDDRDELKGKGSEEVEDTNEEKEEKDEKDEKDGDNDDDDDNDNDDDDDDDEDEDSTIIGKEKPAISKEANVNDKGAKMQKAFEVTPVLSYIGSQIRKSNIMQKSLMKSSIVLLKSNKMQAELIKSLEERLENVESQPVGRKSVAQANAKVMAGQGQKSEMSKSIDESENTLEKAVKGDLPGWMVVKEELNLQD